MDNGVQYVELAEHGRCLVVQNVSGDLKVLHALWVRERVTGAGVVDQVNNQRLYDPALLSPDIRITGVRRDRPGFWSIDFSDGCTAELSLHQIAMECGWVVDPQQPPAPISWTAKTWSASEGGRQERQSLSPPAAFVDDLDDPSVMLLLLKGFFKYGFCVLRGAPTTPGSLIELASRFGFLRETNWGKLFDVFTKREATDLAYTSFHLAAHTDNPYRKPVPGIQFLHCLENTVSGGYSTIVDGFALVARLKEEAPGQAAILEETPVRFRYESATKIMQDTSPIIERGADGRLIGVRLSSRLDFAPPLEPAALDLFYAGRRRLHQLAADPAFEIRYTFEPGMVLMMDNRRTLHGRTAFDHSAGRRFLQGGYIDHDGPDGLYRTLVRDGQGSLGREVA